MPADTPLSVRVTVSAVVPEPVASPESVIGWLASRKGAKLPSVTRPKASTTTRLNVPAVTPVCARSSKTDCEPASKVAVRRPDAATFIALATKVPFSVKAVRM